MFRSNVFRAAVKLSLDYAELFALKTPHEALPLLLSSTHRLLNAGFRGTTAHHN